MATIRRFCCNDLLHFASVNLDHRTDTKRMSTYLKRFVRKPDYCHVAVAPGNRIIAYLHGADNEEQCDDRHWQGLLQVVSVASEYRRQKLGTKLMKKFEKQLLDKMLNTPRHSDLHFSVYLYVSVKNTPGLKFFSKLKYKLTRTLTEVFPNDEDAAEMKKEIVKEELPGSIRTGRRSMMRTEEK